MAFCPLSFRTELSQSSSLVPGCESESNTDKRGSSRKELNDGLQRPPTLQQPSDGNQRIEVRESDSLNALSKQLCRLTPS
eukprot:1158933-Pelagomonas_calceolata.AAC.8